MSLIQNLINLRRQNLPLEEINFVNEVLNTTDILLRHNILVCKFNIDMTYNKISCLRPSSWINDEVVNYYMQLLQDRNDKLTSRNDEMLTSIFFNSFFISTLIYGGYNYEAIRRWTKNINVFALDKIVFPVNVQNTHWTMIVVYMKLKRIHYYDSMNGEGINRYLIHILHWLKDETANKYNNKYIIDDEEWGLIDQENTIPQQDNSSDSGMFSILCADFLSDNIPFGDSYSQVEIPLYRQKVCAAILRGYIRY